MSILPCSIVMIQFIQKTNKKKNMQIATLLFDSDSRLLSQTGTSKAIRFLKLFFWGGGWGGGILLAFLLLTFCKRTSTMSVLENGGEQWTLWFARYAMLVQT